ncbi:N-acetylneuraminate synthase family protein [Novosphingobium album (ex Liu et al. 2023)]|uniref:N-acetylneuraminate synthase family protein n=1 Tax=Novosphingobium album (ex Liu et al. 2023) TaxID=3031130 RepID=A0ABT5WTH5_9SPHN|nr:N-acetylneuraminate synthase family protein [Novosphingobium album (ex Liu et al. 2023)]MDE8653188.1 N-acetylneuraminate synthase family protein [Novosphingobium album (ex Liu et al. 2023)]
MGIKVIAEVGCNHKGDLQIAKEMIQVAAVYAKADVVKFQKRNNRELLTQAQYEAPHPNPANSYGETYGAHREFLEFSLEQHRELAEECRRNGIEYSTSVWDTSSASEIASLNPSLIKIPSACNLHFEMLGLLADSYAGEIHLSLGMTTQEEERRIVSFFKDRGRAGDVVLYACTSGYPVSFDELCLREITRLREAFGEVVKAIGFSGHHLGIAADMAAIALGAQWVERHFTLDRTWKGTDHAASLEPDGLRRVVRDARAVSRSLTYKPQEILEVEIAQREKLKWRPRPAPAAAA